FAQVPSPCFIYLFIIIIIIIYEVLSSFNLVRVADIQKLSFSGSKPFPRYGYKPSPPSGCGSPLFGVHFDIGIPLMTKCCNHHDRCYDTCGNKKNDCDEQFQSCLSKICRDVQKTLGISENVQACESIVQLLFDAVIHLGCKPYLDSQRASCMCRYEDKTDL
uniref:Group XIIA secretory phospholipase A2 n=1 Tax=Meleagris gallopavo TaxID=9103 RepID=A0A803Y6G6_MELGA